MKAELRMKQTPECDKGRAEPHAPHPGVAAVLAFTDIFLCGYLLYFAAFVTFDRGRFPLHDVGALLSVILPALFAVSAFFPTDGLTRTLGQAARIAGVIAFLTIFVRLAAEIARAASVLHGFSFVRAGVVALICSYVSVVAFVNVLSAHLFGCGQGWLPRTSLPSWLGVLYIAGSTSIAFAVVVFSYDGFFYGPRGLGFNGLAIRATHYPAWLAAEVICLFFLVATIPYVLRAPCLARAVQPAMPHAVAMGIAICWTVLGAHWGTLAPGFECLVYVVMGCMLCRCCWLRLRREKALAAPFS